MKGTCLVHRNVGSLREFNRNFPSALIVEFGFFGGFAFSPGHKFFIITIELFQQRVVFSELFYCFLLPVTAIYITQNPFSFKHITLL